MMSVIRRFIRYYRPYRKTLFFDLFCASAASGVDLIIPLLINYLLKKVFPLLNAQTIFQEIIRVAVLMLVLYTIRLFAQYYISSWGHIMGARMEADMRRELFNHFEKLSFSYYDRNNTGHMMSRMIADLFDLTDQTDRLFYHTGEYQSAGHRTVIAGDTVNAGFLHLLQPQDAPHIHGESKKNCRYQRRYSG